MRESDERIIVAERIGKVYHAHDGRESLLQSLFLRAIGKLPERRSIHALRDVTLAVRRGEWLAVVGSNGAGKTTLLKIFAGIARPSSGRIEVRAPAASQFALGAGFHPYLSGRENVYLQGTILGMTNAETRERFDRIVAFAELDGAIERPLWTYSSGMQARLGFAVAAHAEPELLILDEALSAGDVGFRQKCKQAFRDLRAKGATVVVVSHGATELREMCERAIWLDRGTLVAQGSTSEILSRYEAFVQSGGQSEPRRLGVGS